MTRQWYDQRGSTGKQVGYFRTVKTVEATRRSLDRHDYLAQSDERCRYEVKKKHVRGPCGARATRCTGGVWYCKRHNDIMEKKLAEQSQPEAKTT